MPGDSQDCVIARALLSIVSLYETQSSTVDTTRSEIAVHRMPYSDDDEAMFALKKDVEYGKTESVC